MFRSDIVTVLTAMLVAGCSAQLELFDGTCPSARPASPAASWISRVASFATI